jgi:SOS-response transcriptional repressor LexA
MRAMTKVHPTAERLFQAAKLIGKAEKPAEVARLLGVTEQVITNWTRRGVSRDGLLLTQEKIGCSATWLKTGQGAMLAVVEHKHVSTPSDSPDKRQNIRHIKEIPTPNKHRLTGQAPEKKSANVFGGETSLRKVPVISYVQAGMMTEVMDPFALGEGFELITTDLDLSPGAFALVIKGESMLPEFREGDKIVIDPAVQPLPGDMVIAKNTEEEATFKKYRPRGYNERGEMVFELIPLNEDYPVMRSDIEHLRVIGVMVEHRKYRKR